MIYSILISHKFSLVIHNVCIILHKQIKDSLSWLSDSFTCHHIVLNLKPKATCCSSTLEYILTFFLLDTFDLGNTCYWLIIHAIYDSFFSDNNSVIQYSSKFFPLIFQMNEQKLLVLWNLALYFNSLFLANSI